MEQISSGLDRLGVRVSRESGRFEALSMRETRSHALPPQDLFFPESISVQPFADLVKASLESISSHACPKYDIQSDLRPSYRASLTETQLCASLGIMIPAEEISGTMRYRTIEGSIANSIRTTLPDIPIEVLSMVVDLLPPSSVMSLCYSCRTIYSNIGTPIESVLGKKNVTVRTMRTSIVSPLPRMVYLDRNETYALSITSRKAHQSERMKLLCMLDRDHMISPSKSVCSGCADTRDRSLFSLSSLAQPSGERCCMGFSGRLWICPHLKFDHNLIGTSPSVLGSHNCGDNTRVIIRDRRPCVVWPIVVLLDNITPPRSHVEDILGKMRVHICKHLRFCDPWVSRLYDPTCRKLRWMNEQKDLFLFCTCSLCVPQNAPVRNVTEQLLSRRHIDLIQIVDGFDGGACEFCGTKVVFRIARQENGADFLQLVVRREIKDFQGNADPAWIEQVTDPASFETLERDWSEATRQIDERLGRIYQ